jgi:hypothetical protein
MKEVLELIMMSDDYILGRIHEKASSLELEGLIRLRIKNQNHPRKNSRFI